MLKLLEYISCDEEVGIQCLFLVIRKLGKVQENVIQQPLGIWSEHFQGKRKNTI